MKNNWNIPSFKKYVKRCENKNESELKSTALKWLKVSAENRAEIYAKSFGLEI